MVPSDSNMPFPIHSPSLHLSSLLWRMNTSQCSYSEGEEGERLTNRQVTLQMLLDKFSEGCCVKPRVMICISSQYTSRPGGETKGHICGSDGRLLFCSLLASFTGMVDPTDTPYLTVKNLTLSGKILFHFVDFFLVFVQCLTKWGLIIWIPDHMYNKVKGIDLCYTNKCSVKDNFQLLCQVTSCEATG